MERKLSRVITLFLSLWIGLAPAALSVPAAALSLQVAGVLDTKSGDCDCCPESGRSPDLCILTCANVPPLMTTPTKELVRFARDNGYLLELKAMMVGWIAPPDPPPPRRPSFA